MFMTWPQMLAAWPFWHQLIENGVDQTDERGFDAAVRNIELHPDKPDTREYRLEPRVMEKAEDPGPDFSEFETFNPFEVHRQPLPLAEVIANLKALHRNCNGRHTCGIPAKYRDFNPERFDLGTWADLVSAHQRHVATGLRNRVKPPKSDAETAAEMMRRGLPHPEDGVAWRARSNREIERREARRRRG